MKAFYDHKPEVIEAVGNGSFFYRHHIEEQEVEAHEEGAAGMTQWAAEEVVVWERSSNAIVRAVIADRWDSDYEQKLINEYNAAKLGIHNSIDAENRYVAFLTERNALKEMVDADCKTLGIR